MDESLAQDGGQARGSEASAGADTEVSAAKSADLGHGMGPLGLPVRPTARILLLDPDGRVLLFRFDDDKAVGERVWWTTPGGGVDPGESIAEAGARELFEETGLRAAPEELGPVVAWNEGTARFTGGGYWFLNRYFVLRVDEFALDTSRWQEIESSLITRHRWWSPRELAELPEPVHPHGLRRFLARLADGWLPREPVDLGLDRQGADGPVPEAREDGVGASAQSPSAQSPSAHSPSAQSTSAQSISTQSTSAQSTSTQPAPPVLCDGRTAAGFRAA